MRFLYALFLILCHSVIYGQDLMYLKGQKQPLKVTVAEIGIDEVKYKYWPVGEDALVLVIAKENLSKIIMQNGDEISFASYGMKNKVDYSGQRKDALKFSLLSPLAGHLGFSYEKSIRPGKSYEAGLGIIGLGVEVLNPQPWGGFIRLGFKFINTPDFYLRGMKYSHLLKGGYVKPEVTFSSHSAYDGMFGAALLINFGRQVVYDDSFIIDYFIGIGYGYSSHKNAAYYYSFVGGTDVPMALSAGLKFGFMIGEKNELNKQKAPEK